MLPTQRVPPALQPALKAYVLGYVLDVLPALLKLLLRFGVTHTRVLSQLRRRQREERAVRAESGRTGSAAPSVRLHDADGSASAAVEGGIAAAPPTSLWTDGVRPALGEVPLLLARLGRALLVALGPHGMASAAAFALAGSAVLERVLRSALGLLSLPGHSGPGAPGVHVRARQRAFQLRVAATFFASTLSSGAALYLLQHAAPPASSSAAASGSKALPALGGSAAPLSPVLPRSALSHLNPFRRGPSFKPRSSHPTPLAPGGHFLSRLTALSLPATPAAPAGALSPTRDVTPLPDEGDEPPNGLLEPPSSPGVAETAANEAEGTNKAAQRSRPSPTIDITLVAIVRALDTVLRGMPALRTLFAPANKGRPKGHGINGLGGPDAGLRLPKRGQGLVSKAASAAANQAEGLTFVVACAVIMWNWFYHPQRLPPTYVKWISNLATMDERLLVALRCLRNGEPYLWRYGDPRVPPAGIQLLGGLSESLGHPYEWGDPSRMPHDVAHARALVAQARAENAALRAAGKAPEREPLREPKGEPGFIFAGASGPRGRGDMGGMPCELVHCGTGGASCWKNAALRWLRAWRMCMGIYIPVQLVPRLLFNPKQFVRTPLDSFIKVLQGSARSSAFISTFTASIWFMVCLGRTLLLPRLFPSVSHRFWDAGLGPMLGSLTCGWSVFIEDKRKRAEMALYVAPRALMACAEMAKPGWASGGAPSALMAERILFGLSIGVITSAARYRPDLLRGITSLMAWVVRTSASQQRRAALAPAPRARA